MRGGNIGAVGRAERLGHMRWASSLAAVAWLGLIGTAEAQTIPEGDPQMEATAKPEERSDDIVVTGSRIQRRDYSSSTPVVTVGQDLLKQTADFAIETKLQQLPQFAASTTSQFNALFTGTGASTLNLRNLGDNRNLILLDGRRLQPSTSNFAIDVNTIPSSLIENVEVITGGASAVYGSDAISGVINFRLKRNFRGLQLDAQSGISARGDADNQNITLTVGDNFADDRGNAVIAFDYASRGTFRQIDRAFYRRAWEAGISSGSFLGQGSFAGGVNLPSQAAVNGYFAQFGAPAGAVPNSSQIGFNGGNSLFNVTGRDVYNWSSLLPLRQAVSQTTPTSRTAVEYPFTYQILAVPLERKSLFSKLNYDVNDYVTAYVQGYYTHYNSRSEGGPSQLSNFWAIPIPRDAAHPVPAAFGALLDSRPSPAAPWTLSKSTLYLGQRVNQNKTDIFQALIGLTGKIPGLGDWTYDLNGSHGRSQLVQTGTSGFIRHSRYITLFQAPNYGRGYSDASGSCTSGFNPFGLEQPSQDCINYVTARPVYRTELKQSTAELNLQGKLFSLPGGDVRAAVGGGYRRNTYLYKPDDIATIARSSNLDTDFSGNFVQTPQGGAISVKEVYAELLVPLLRDKPFFRSLEASFGYRYSDYSATGGVSAYKADLNWQPFEAVRVRGGYQRAVRAPNVTELFQPASAVLATPQDPCRSTVTLPYANVPGNPNRTQVQTLCRALMGPGAPPITDAVNDPRGLNNYNGGGNISVPSFVAGNAALQPETADTITAGVVLQPKWQLPMEARISGSIDYYNIRLKDAISFVSAQAAYDFCFNANGTSNPSYDPTYLYCRALGRDQTPGSGGITTLVNVQFQNQGAVRTDGIDFQLDLSFRLGPGRFRINSLTNNIRSFTIQIVPGAPKLQYAGFSGGGFGQQGAYFDWKFFNTFTYEIGPATFGLRWQRLNDVRNVAKVTAPTSTLPDIKPYNLVDLFGNVAVKNNLTFRWGVTNLFDQEQPVTGATLGTTDPYDYDIIGRRFFVGATVKF